MSLQQLFDQAVGFHKRGQLAEAERLYRKILVEAPGSFRSHHLIGVIRTQQGRHAEAREMIAAALKINPRDIGALFDYGNVLKSLGRFEEALASYEAALEVDADFLPALNERGAVLWHLKRFGEALASYDRLLAIGRENAEAHHNRGLVLSDLNRPAEALASYEAALAIKPDYVEALYNRGNTLWTMKRFEEALASFDAVLSLRPVLLEALNSRGVMLWKLGRADEALSTLDRILAIEPNFVEALGYRGAVLWDMRRPHEALKSLDKALAIKPDFVDALNNRGNVLLDLNRFREAAEAYQRILELAPDHPYALGGLSLAVLSLCDWKRVPKIAAEINARMEQCIIPPVTLLGYSDDPSLQLRCARINVKERIPVSLPPLWNGAPHRHDKIRVAYLSPDFNQHPVAFQMVELLERHDRARFNVLGISTGVDDGSQIRARVVKAFDEFHDIRAKSGGDAAALLRSLEVDIAVDLGGHTRGGCLEILAHRPCPVQASYLGYAGTTGADFIDYVIADRIVAPFEDQAFFSERIVHLPNGFFPSDTKRPIAALPTRAEAGLPAKGFIFCCFNKSSKITEPVFSIWMRLLNAVPGSILWLKPDSAEAQEYLHAAAACHVSPDRLVFADKAEDSAHLARYGLADLFLDTLPYNAHATACDALRAGLPVLTCCGNAFAGRVAASLLHAAGLPELVTCTLPEYEALALKLAREPELLQSLRRKLQENRTGCPLFDTDQLRRNIEAAYVKMWEMAERGVAPGSFAIPESEVLGRGR